MKIIVAPDQNGKPTPTQEGNNMGLFNRSRKTRPGEKQAAKPSAKKTTPKKK